METARKLVLSVILGVWQQFWCLKLGTTFFSTPPFKLATFLIAQKDCFFQGASFALKKIVASLNSGIERRFIPNPHIPL